MLFRQANVQNRKGGDCKTLMFVQISPNAADFGETLCSLNFASRVRGVEQGPARKQQDHTELFKFKQLVEKLKQDEKETKKVHDNMQNLQLRLAAREHLCRNLQEKVRDLESQLAEERKTRLKQETRARASVSIQQSLSSTNHPHKAPVDKKPPLAPSNLRLPLRRISNMMSSGSSHPLPSKNNARKSFLPVVNEEKENLQGENKARLVLKPRRGSIAVGPLPPPTTEVRAPKRRSSIATLWPEPSANMAATATGGDRVMGRRSAVWGPHRPKPSMDAATAAAPIRRSRGGDRVMGRQSYVWDPQRMWRSLRVSSPPSPPVGHESGSKLRGSPPSGGRGSRKSRRPTVVALQKKKSLVWSPLKLKQSLKYRRSSLMS